MTPEQFLKQLETKPPASAYLFLGAESYERGRCRQALAAKVLGGDTESSGLERVDLEETSLAAVLDDARSLSLFATQRLLWISSAETALPRRITENSDESGTGALLADYLRTPTESVTVVFECSRYEFEGDDKSKLERVQKFYSAIPNVVEFRAFTVETARRLAQDLARAAELKIGTTELGLLIEVLGGDASRIANEIEKLRLYAGTERKVTAEDVLQTVPNAQGNNIFQLVSALGRGDRKRSLDGLDALVKQGEYLPLALTFLATQFRLALAAQEANLKTSQQIQAYFTKQGIRIWRDRAEQVSQTITAFPKKRLETALSAVYEADKALRDRRPDDRVVMEKLVLNLTRAS